MRPKAGISPLSELLRGCLIAAGLLLVPLSLPIYVATSLIYTESKGPFKNWMQVVDWEGDGDLDVMVSHARWEDVDLSWAGVGLWINDGDGTFALRNAGDGEDWPFLGHAGAAADLDQDGDLDVLAQEFDIDVLVDQGGVQAGAPGQYFNNGGINPPAPYAHGYRDMGGSITMGDLNGDGRSDALVTGCCYGINASESGDDFANAPSVSWVWINDGRQGAHLNGHTLPMDFLEGSPIRQAALGDLDADGDLDAVAAVDQPTMGEVDSLGDLVLINDGTGTFAALEQRLGDADSTSVALGDVNGDGTLDALVGTSLGAAVLLNQGNQIGDAGPMFVAAEQFFAARQTPTDKLGAAFSTAADRMLGLYLPIGRVRTKAVFLADIDADGDQDALLARPYWAEIWWNDGHGVFSRSGARLDYPEDTGVAVADFDGDGDQDIFAAGNIENHRMWRNDGNGDFALLHP